MQTLVCPYCSAITGCDHDPVPPNENHRQVMPQTIEAYKALAQRDLELIMEMKDEISNLKQKVNKLEQQLKSKKIRSE